MTSVNSTECEIYIFAVIRGCAERSRLKSGERKAEIRWAQRV